jgi:hypothetical protein
MLGVAVGCAHGPPSLASSTVEAAYVDARRSHAVCRDGDGACCGQQAAAARAAAGRGESARAARLWDEVALACPGLRAEATAAGRPTPVAGGLNVTYRPRLSPDVRLFWVSAAAGSRLLPASLTPQGIEVEVEAIRFSHGRPGPLLAITRRFDLPLSPGASIDIVIRDAPAGATAPLEVTAEVQPPPPTGRPSTHPVRPAPAPRLEKAQPLRVPAPRAPLELAPLPAGAGPAVRLCLDREGEVDSVRFLDGAHPRFAASLVDMFRDARYEPYRVNDLAVPSCQVVRP